MFTLSAEKNKYYRIKQGQSGQEVSSRFCVPVTGSVFAGRIITLDKEYSEYEVSAGESYKSISKAFGVPEGELKEINGNRAVYPTQKLLIPRKRR